jgi:hypothetical protein
MSKERLLSEAAEFWGKARPDEGGQAKGGPMSRILEAIIPIISGETPGAIAIGTQLTLNARKKSKKAD